MWQLHFVLSQHYHNFPINITRRLLVHSNVFEYNFSYCSISSTFRWLFANNNWKYLGLPSQIGVNCVTQFNFMSGNWDWCTYLSYKSAKPWRKAFCTEYKNVSCFSYVCSSMFCFSLKLCYVYIVLVCSMLLLLFSVRITPNPEMEIVWIRKSGSNFDLSLTFHNQWRLLRYVMSFSTNGFFSCESMKAKIYYFKDLWSDFLYQVPSSVPKQYFYHMTVNVEFIGMR